MYGAKRLGVIKENCLLMKKPTQNGNATPVIVTASKPPAKTSIYPLGKKHYESTDRLGNVRVTYTEKKSWNNGKFALNVSSSQDYYPFGSVMEGRGYNLMAYRYGVQGQEKVNEVSGSENHYTALFWEMAPRLGRRWNVDPKPVALESVYAVNRDNPNWYTDPNGDFTIVDDAIVGFFKGLFGKRGSDGKFSEGGTSRIGNAFRRAGRDATNSAKIWGGLFASDKEKSFGGRVLEVASRLTWQLPQTIGGLLYNQGASMFGNVSGVEYFHGATAVKGAGIGGGAVTLGSYISLSHTSLDPQANVGVGPGSYTFMHEYGHYLQSQRNGPSYLFKYGLPSIFAANWTEWDANQRAANYFHKIQPSFTWDPNFYPVGTLEHTYSRLPAGGKIHNTKWWEYFILPAVPVLNINKPR
ncbi:MAG: hypothetical protein KatS3mg035_2045 [Bacteroidia bacterium]|nr:MAG: hypothetical protein KatS3mg035_2045 [Bacteroidia bacterium]